MKMTDIDFLIIGAAKSATTWLQQSLQLDPLICMPGPELHYFSREYERGDEWYLSQFPNKREGQIAGEKSNSYLDEPQALPRIHKALAHAKLVAQLRNPVERAYSDYCMLYRRGEVNGDIARHLDPREAADGRFLVGGLYHSQLAAYLEQFAREQLLVVLYEDTRAKPVETLATVCGHIGLEKAVTPLKGQKRVKDKTTPMVPPGMKRYLGPLKPVVAPFRDNALFKQLRGLVAREIRYPALPDDLRDRLVDFYAPETEQLGRMLDRDLSGWLLAAASKRDEGAAARAAQAG